MSKSNSSGAFERARQRWHFGIAYLCRRLGRGATGALQASVLLVEHTNRALFYGDGYLVAFPSLDRLALLAGVSERTMRRAINKLEQIGGVRIQHRHNDSNLYYLTLPPEAEKHLFDCDAAIIRRRKARRRADTKCPPGRTDGNGSDTKCPTTSDLHSDLHSFTKWRDEESRLWENKKEKRAAEEEGQAKERESPDASPDSFSSLGSAFRIPRPDWGNKQ